MLHIDDIPEDEWRRYVKESQEWADATLAACSELMLKVVY